MDPNQALKDARDACKRWTHGEDHHAFNELVSAFQALDQWLSRGGFLPRDWERKALHDVTPTKE